MPSAAADRAVTPRQQPRTALVGRLITTCSARTGREGTHRGRPCVGRGEVALSSLLQRANFAVSGYDGCGRGCRTVRAVSGVWRWRHNPLRRATDRREAWVALVALLLMVLAAPALGWLCGALTDDVLQQSVRFQQTQRHATTAVVVRRAPGRGSWSPIPRCTRSVRHRRRCWPAGRPRTAHPSGARW